jgi:dihydrolipoamide dehydrogenase
MAQEFDLIVIGSGPGGYVAAIRASQLGQKVAIVERENLGGICLNWGCIPTKALLKSGEKYESLSHLKDYGLSADKVGFDFDAIIARSRGVAKQLNAGVGFLMKKNKIEVIEGSAKLEKGQAAPRVIIALKAGGSRTVEAKAVMLAVGARAKAIPQIGLEADGDKIWAYREAMAPKSMPKSIVVIGSGAIGIEFGSFYRALGAEVTVVEAVDRIMPVEDEEVSRAAQKSFEKRGMKFRTGCKVTKVAKSGRGVQVDIEAGGKPETLEAEVCISAVGITANTDGIGLEALGVNMDRGHITIDGNCQTNVKGLYAIGDCAGAPWLAHKASHEGIHAAEHIAGFKTPNLHLRPTPGGFGRPDGAGGPRSQTPGQDRPLPLQGERQGHRLRRHRRFRQGPVRRQNRRINRRTHDRRRGHGDDPGLRHRHHHGGDRGGHPRHRLSAPDHV